jgi:hypothetical protein
VAQESIEDCVVVYWRLQEVRSSTVIVDGDKKLGREEISRKKLLKLSLGAMKSNDHGKEDSAAGLLIVIWEGSTKTQAQRSPKVLDAC